MVVFISDVNTFLVFSLVLRSLDVSREMWIDPLTSSFLHEGGGIERLVLFLDVASYKHELKMEGSEPVFDLVSVSVKEVRLAWLDILFHFH